MHRIGHHINGQTTKIKTKEKNMETKHKGLQK